MVYSGVMLLLAAADTALLAWTIACWRRLRHPALALITFLVLALPYDTLLVAAGPSIGQGPLLERLSGPRFMLLHLSIPLTLVLLASIARLAGFAWARSRAFMTGACLLATVLLVLDWRRIFTFPALYPACWQDTLRYVTSVVPAQACGSDGAGVGVPGDLPWGAAVVLPALVLLGGLLWWKRGWPWLLAGGVTALFFPALQGTLGPLPGFLGDTLNMLAFAVTAVHFAGDTRARG